MSNNEMILTMILPMYNEEGNVVPLLAALERVRVEKKVNIKIIAVNDGSKDNTLRVLREQEKQYKNLMVVDHPKNQGLATTLKTGIRTALEQKASLLGFMDSDLTHDPNDLPAFMGKIAQGFDFVIGSRYIPGGAMQGVPLFRVLISQIGNIFVRFLLGIAVKDFTSGYRVIKADVLRSFEIEEKGFGIQLEEVVKAYSAGYKITEVPIILKTRTYGTSSMRYNLAVAKNYFILFKRSYGWVRNKK